MDDKFIQEIVDKVNKKEVTPGVVKAVIGAYYKYRYRLEDENGQNLGIYKEARNKIFTR